MGIIYGANTNYPKAPEPQVSQTQEAQPQAAPAQPEEQAKPASLDQHLQELQQSGASEVRVEGDQVVMRVPVDSVHSLHIDQPDQNQAEPQQEDHDEQDHRSW